ncbi:hypothetical protein M0R45_011203 [Rubus argutus]|uniref:Uncharacterized protein n=1 Tax=Rubus argutus TaxID=59490 RepID=A0AAW1YBT2_RUBAR
MSRRGVNKTSECFENREVQSLGRDGARGRHDIVGEQASPATATAGMAAVEAEADVAVEASHYEDNNEENDDGAEHDLAVESVVGGFVIVVDIHVRLTVRKGFSFQG